MEHEFKSEYEIIVETIKWGKNNPNVPQEEIKKEEEKLKICNQCPKRESCFSCGVHEWWISKGRQPVASPRF